MKTATMARYNNRFYVYFLTWNSKGEVIAERRGAYARKRQALNAIAGSKAVRV